MKSFVLVGLAVIAVTLHECHADLQWPEADRINPIWYNWNQWSRYRTNFGIRKEDRIYRIYHRGAVTIGTMDPESFTYTFDNAVYHQSSYTYHQYSTNPLVEELDSNDPRRFNWIPTNTSHVKYLVDKHLIVGGTINLYPVLIGRTRSITSTEKYRYGAIIIQPKQERFEYVDDEQRAQRQQGNFDVLAFDDSCLDWDIYGV